MDVPAVNSPLDKPAEFHYKTATSQGTLVPFAKAPR